VRQVDFNDLPRPTRERFVRSLVSDSPVARPICRRVSKPRSAVAWYLLLVLALTGMGVLASLRFGWPDAPTQDPSLIGGYAGGCAVLAIGLSMRARRRAIKGSLPFAPGVYVFAVDVVDARTRELVLYPLSTLEAFDVVHHAPGGKYTHSTLRFAFPTTTFTFECRGREAAEAEVAAVQQARANVAAALEARDGLAALAAVDPFAEARARRFAPARDHGLLARGRPTWTRYIWAITLGAGVMFGFLSWRLRNWASDERAFARVASTLDVGVAEAYVRAGGLRAAEVESSVLPRAHLAAAKKERDAGKRADAIERLLQRFPKSTIEKDARAALAEAQHVDFVARGSSVADLRAFIAQWPEAADVPAARVKIAELYRQTRADFHKHANITDKSVVPLVDAMLGYTEERGLPLEVHFRRHAAPSLAGADKAVSEGLIDDGARAHAGPVSQALAAACPRAEAALVAALQRTLKRVFPADVIALRAGARLEGPAPIPGTPPVAEVSAPTVVVDYEVGWAGAAYATREASTRFVGIVVKFDVAVQVPNEPRVLHFGSSVDPPETLPIDYTPADSVFEPLLAAPGARGKTIDVHVYPAMLARAFDQLASRWRSVFFEADAAMARELTGPRGSPLPQ